MLKTNNTPAETLNDLVAASCHKFADRPALSLAFEEPFTYGYFLKKIINLAALLADAGVKKKDKIAILATNSPNWALAYMAIIRLGAIAVPILPDFPGADVRHIIQNSKTKILFTVKQQIEKIEELEHPAIHTIITLDNSQPAYSSSSVEPLSHFLARADVLPAAKLQPAIAPPKVSADDIASIIYTSGTSGHSKAVMLSHGNLLSNVCSLNKLIDIKEDWTFLSILPMSHTYEFTLGFLLPLYNGARIVYAGKSPTPTLLGRICTKEKPTAINVVPMVMEKIYKKRVLAAIESNTILRISTKIPGIRKKIYKKIGSKLLDFFGGKLQLLAIGGAAINSAAEQFLRDAQFPYLIGYGLTETSPVLAGGPYGDQTIAVGSTGKPIPGVEVRIDKPDPQTGIGEIVARGPNIMKGYADNPEATAKTIDQQGWLSTGDLGCFDDKGNLYIKGRSKSVIVLAHGENIYPEYIEEKINTSIHVIESLVVEHENRLEARIYLDYDLVNEKTKNKSNQQKKEYIVTLLKEIQQSVNEQLPTYSKIHKVLERQEPFIKTATHKIKRYLYLN